MIRVPDRVRTEYPQRARDELGAVWDQLQAAAEREARRVRRRSRRRVRQTRERASLATLALRGELSPQPWRWFATGLAVGAAAGVVGTVALARRRRTTDQVDDLPAGDAERAPAGTDPTR